jgi:hypothetical protein
MENHGPDDPVAVYIREVGSVRPLAKDEEIELFRKLAGLGDWDETGECREKINYKRLYSYAEPPQNDAKKAAETSGGLFVSGVATFAGEN